jgi:serine O-acetyltransferase
MTEMPGVYRNDSSNWDLSQIVQGLREVRVRLLEDRQRIHRPPKLPSRKIVAGILDQLTAVLFPNRLGPADLTDEGIDYFVGHTLDVALRALTEQLFLELRFNAAPEVAPGVLREQAIATIHRFAEQLPTARALLETDIQAAYEGDPAARSVDEVVVCYPGITAITYHRMAHEFYKLDALLLARTIAEIAHSTTGIDIHPGAQIGRRFFIDHGTGVVIGETAIIGENVRLYQAVTLGAKRFPVGDDGALVKGNARHPIVEDDVIVYAGATILGRVTIGRGSTIGGNVWLTHSVPPGSNISQAQIRNECFIDGAGI